MAQHLLAFDLGAESGRAVLGRLSDEGLTWEEVHRFPNQGVRVFDHLYWDVLRLYDEIKSGIGKAARVAPQLASLGIDSWAVDFGLIGRSGQLLGGVHHYRDPRTDGVMERVWEIIPKETLYQHTGVQFLPFNTLYQLYALKQQEPALLDGAHRLAMIGELFTYFLTGEVVAEFTNASTTQLLHPQSRTWHRPLFDALDLPIDIMPDVVPPGTVVGPLLPKVAADVGLSGTKVLVPAVHDTGSAVAAVPAETGSHWAFISSGTWSLVGVEVPQAIVTPQSLHMNVSNEGGVADTFRHLKNVMGLWLLQECRRTWQREGTEYTYEELAHKAEAAPPWVAHVDPDAARFFEPGDMPGKIRDYVRERGGPSLDSVGAVARCIFESLALKYRYVLDELTRTTNRSIDVIHIVGGGAQNELLNQMTADATGKVVVAGPYEATAAGNLIVQGIGIGALSTIDEGRDLVRRSVRLRIFEPTKQDRGAWDEAYGRFVHAL